MNSYEFRRAVQEDAPRSWELICQAKALMALEGRSQWTESYPSPKDISEDIAAGNAYVLCIDGVPMAYGAVVFSGEPAYEQIAGEWLTVGDYVVVHRLCVADEARGRGLAQAFFHEVSALALSKGIHSFKVDTNFDNAAMLHILSRLGFAFCGRIFYPQGGAAGV